MQRTVSPSIDADEVAKFSAMAEEWWDTAGQFAPLHALNPVRLGYLKTQICAHFERNDTALTPFGGLKVVDIGCGGGLLCEPLARLGADVTGADASDKNIRVARAHAAAQHLKIHYRCTTAEALAHDGAQFDIVLAMEVVEHVADAGSFLESCAHLLKPDGLMVTATLNRTLKSYALAIVGAEYLLRWVPRGTHDFNRFMKPAELSALLSQAGLKTSHPAGLRYNPLADRWTLTDDVAVNYMLSARKEFA